MLADIYVTDSDAVGFLIPVAWMGAGVGLGYAVYQFLRKEQEWSDGLSTFVAIGVAIGWGVLWIVTVNPIASPRQALDAACVESKEQVEIALRNSEPPPEIPPLCEVLPKRAADE